MSRRITTTGLLVMLLSLSAVAGGRSQEQPLVGPELLQKAHSRGAVRILVKVDAPHVSEINLPSRAHVTAQRRNVQSVQGLVRGTLRGVPHRVVRDFEGAVPLMAMEVGPDGLRMLESLRGVVVHVAEDRPRRLQLDESVPRIQADQAATLGYDGTGTAIVIMDTGVDLTHPFFRDESGTSRIVAEACFSSTSSIDLATSLCPGALPGNGAYSSTVPGSGAACASSIDGCDHGTLVAGIAAGRGTSFNGVAPGADIVSIQVFSRFDDVEFCGVGRTPCVGSFPSDEIAAGLYIKNTLIGSLSSTIASINLALGSLAFAIPCDSTFPDEAAFISELRTLGIATVVASGNEHLNGKVAVPACISSTISVGASTSPPTEAIATFSNRAPGMSLLAPGLNINTSTVGGDFDIVSGTSMSVPHVAGAFAIFRQALPAMAPNQFVGQVLTALQNTGQLIGGFRRIRILDALGTFPGVVPTVQFAGATFDRNEGDATNTVTVTVTRTGPPAVLADSPSSVVVSSGPGGSATPGTTGTTDYVPVVNQLVTFAAGETSRTVPITVRGDFTIEPDETVPLNLSTPFAALLGAQRTATLRIVNDDVPGTMFFQPDTYTVNETAGTATITIRRTGGLAAAATATVSTVAGGTATAGTDYTPLVNKVVTFLGGADTATFTVPIVNDTLAEPNETVKLRIMSAGPAGAIVGSPSDATLTIVSEDVAGSVQFSHATYDVTEGTATKTITVIRSDGTASGVTVQYRVSLSSPGTALAGVDYTLATGTLSFGANETTKTFVVPIVNDTIIESDETVNLELFNPQPAGLTRLGLQSTAVLTIHDNDAPTFRFGAAAYSVAEGAPGNVTVVRANGVGSLVTVGYQIVAAGTAPATGGGTDYVLGDGTVTFPVGVTTQSITIPTTQDTLFEGGETIALKLVNPSDGGILVAPATTTVTIGDNDAAGVIQFSAATYSQMENAVSGSAVVRVTRTGSNLASGITVDFTTDNGTATAGSDYTTSTRTLTFGALEAFKDIEIPITNDGAAEGNETIRLSLDNVTGGATLGAIKNAVLTILDDEQSFGFSAPAYVVTEATTNVTVTVTRTGPPVGTVTVDYDSIAGSATAGTDYTNVAGTLTFAPGMTSRTFVVPIISDTVFETSESVALVLSNPTGGAQLGPRSTSVITIVDNDPPGSIRFSAPTYATSEAAGATITVTRAGGTASLVTVDYATVGGGTATAGSDYTPTSGTVTFGAGQASATFTVAIVNDSLDELAETVKLELSNPKGGATLGAQSTAVLSITDDDVPGPIAFSAPTFTVAEGAGVAMIRVTRPGGAAGVTIDFKTEDGSATAGADYTDASQTLTFLAGETTRLIGIPILTAGGREGNETVRLRLEKPTGGAALGTYSQAVLTITDNETGPTVQFSAAAYSVAENVATTQAMITITRTGSTIPGQTVHFSATGGTASSGVDFVAIADQTVTFTGTQASVTVPVTLVNNTAVTGSRTVNLALFNPGGGLNLGVPRTAVLSIQDDDSTIQFTSGTASVAEGGTVTLTVTRTGGTISTATVVYATGEVGDSALAPGDYTAKTGVLTFTPGVTSRTITVTTINDIVTGEGNETFTVKLSNPSPAGTALGGPSAVTVTITDTDAPGVLQLSSDAYSVNEGTSAVLKVTRTLGSTGMVTVDYATSNGGSGATGGGVDYTTTIGTLTFLNGVTSLNITVPTKIDTAQEGPETFTVTLTNAGGGASVGSIPTAIVTIVDRETPRIQFATANYAVAEAVGSVTLTVTRVGPTTSQVTVPFTLAGVTATGGGVDFNSTSGTLTFPVGTTSRTIVVPINNDMINETPETFTVTLSTPTGGGAILGAPATATVTISDNDPAGVVLFSQASYAVVEGGTAIITVTRSGGTAGPVTVDYATSDGTATEPGDYTATSGTLTFEAGETTQTFAVPTTSDGQNDGSRSVLLTLSNAAGGLVVGPSSAAALWIVDQP